MILRNEPWAEMREWSVEESDEEEDVVVFWSSAYFVRFVQTTTLWTPSLMHLVILKRQKTVTVTRAEKPETILL